MRLIYICWSYTLCTLSQQWLVVLPFVSDCYYIIFHIHVKSHAGEPAGFLWNKISNMNLSLFSDIIHQFICVLLYVFLLNGLLTYSNTHKIGCVWVVGVDKSTWKIFKLLIKLQSYDCLCADFATK